MYLLRKNGSTSNVIRRKLRSSATGQGLTGLTSASAGLIVSTICDNESAAVTYTAAGSTIETIATLGTYAAPTATKCRFKEVDSVNHPGLYEIQLADARFAVAGAKTLRITVSGAASLLEQEVVIQLSTFDVDSASPDVNTSKVGGQTASASGTVTFPNATLASTTNITAGTITTTTNLTNLPAIPANWLTAAGIAAGALNGKGDWLLSASYSAPPSAATNAAAVRTELAVELARVDVAMSTRVGLSNVNIGADGVIQSNEVQVNGLPAEAQDILTPLAALQAAVNAAPATWGASVVGNGRTRDFFLQGGTNKVVRTANAMTGYATDDTTILWSLTITQDGTLLPLATVTPT